MKHIYLLVSILILSINVKATDDTNNLYFVFLRTNPDKAELPDAEVEKLQAAHMKNIEDLYAAGRLVAAGPLEGGGGIFIMKSNSLEASTADIYTDPAIKANRFIVDIHPMAIYKGNICPVGETYEMVSYKFIEFTPAGKLNQCCLHEFSFLLEDYGNEDETIASYYLGDTCGGILILNTEDEKSVSSKLDAVEFISKEKIKYSIRTLWIAKETFCKE